MKTETQQTALPESLQQVLVKLKLVEEDAPLQAEPLTGGVASDIWHVACGDRHWCMKRALEQLRVEREWRVPTHRNSYEAAWLEIVATIAPGCAPQVLGHDPEAGVLVMGFFAPERYRNWKSELRTGVVDSAAVLALAELLARIHNTTAGDSTLAQRFDDGTLFYQLRLEPYLMGAASRHADLSDRLNELAEQVASNRLVLVHGDVSPKNILVGDDGIVLLDAECACIGDPAFDLAFFLNHLLLKCLWVPAARGDLLSAYATFSSVYLAAVEWEQAAALETRVASLLPGLLLARVDGKSPVEYLTAEQQVLVREFARKYLLAPPGNLAVLADAWAESLPGGATANN